MALLPLIRLAALHQADITIIRPAVTHQADTITLQLQQHMTEESRSLSP